MDAPELLIVGHVASDHIGADVRLGGAASFAARAAAHLGVRTAVVTAAPPDFELLAPLERGGIELVRLPAANATTFELDYSGAVRQVRLLARAPDIRPADIPDSLRRAPLAYVAPVCGECDRDLVASLSASRVMVGAQGWLRAVREDGRVEAAMSPEAADPPDLFGVVFSELDHPDAPAIALGFSGRTRVVALTRGAAGADLLVDGASLSVPAVPAEEVDPTGAGDVFGLVLALAMHRGVPADVAARLAATAAARVVEGAGIGRLAEFCASEDWLRVLSIRP